MGTRAECGDDQLAPTVECGICLEPLAPDAAVTRLCGDGGACSAVVCAPCARAHFAGLVAAGFDGACPRMRCV